MAGSKSLSFGVRYILLAVLLAVTPLLSLSVSAAPNAAVNLSPSTTPTTGSSFNVGVTISAPDTARGAQVIVEYDSDKLDLTNVAQSTSPFEAAIYEAISAGRAEVVRGTFGAGSSDTLSFMTLTFNAKSTGSSTVRVASGTEVTSAADGSNMWNGTQTSTTITVSDPAPAPDPTPDPPADDSSGGSGDSSGSDSSSGSTGNSGSGSSGSGSDTGSSGDAGGSDAGSGGDSADVGNGDDGAPTNPPADEVLDEEPSEERSYRRAVIRLKSKVPVKAQVFFGLDGQMNLSTEETAEFSTNPRINIDPQLIEPGRTYTYKVVLTDENGNATETQTREFRATGLKVRLVIRDRDGNPLRKIKVVLRSEPREGVTDDNGVVEFDDVELGNHELTYEFDGNEITQTLSVVNNVTTDENDQEVIPRQTFEFVAQSSSNSNVQTIAVIAGVSLLVLVAVWFLFNNRMKLKRVTAGVSPNEQPKVATTEEHQETLMEMEARVRTEPESNNPEQIIRPTNKDNGGS